MKKQTSKKIKNKKTKLSKKKGKSSEYVALSSVLGNEKIRQSKLEKQLALQAKEKEFKDEIKLGRERKKELQKFIRLEQLEVRREQAEKQRKFLEQIKLEKKIEQFRKREILEIKNLEKFVLSQERESYEGVQERIDAIKQKYRFFSYGDAMFIEQKYKKND